MNWYHFLSIRYSNQPYQYYMFNYLLTSCTSNESLVTSQ